MLVWFTFPQCTHTSKCDILPQMCTILICKLKINNLTGTKTESQGPMIYYWESTCVWEFKKERGKKK